ncbi:MAG: PKD domain-containing protein [Bacteroidetes bacterium]|nr:PKD domain-containing protein [Bacteroidota bacterium]
MKKIIISAFLFISSLQMGLGQQHVYRTCDTDVKWREVIKTDPEAAERNAQLREFRKLFIASPSAQKRISSTGIISYRIPVVFHVIHKYGTENISRAQILDGLNLLNLSFQKLNSDTNQVIPLFQSIFADCEIELVLANIDPFGNCTDGITRTYSTLTSSAGDNVKALIDWPSNQYFNIWVVQNIASGAAGYAYYPGANANIDGVVIRHDYVGGIGTSNGTNYTERSLTHEVGHWLDLPHTWGSTNNPGVASNCNTDDGISDTPNTIGTANFSCNTAQSTCGVIDNVQNYMDYASCHYMFTEGQKAAMHATLNSSVGSRDNLSTLSNWIATGTEIGRVIQTCTPVADFSIQKRGVCAGSSITFKDVSWGGEVATRLWTFQGGTPATDTSANPTIAYLTPGVYNVTLSVSNSTGTDVITRSGVVEVSPNPGVNLIPYSEGFETIAFPSNGWIVENLNNNNAWGLSSAAAATGSNALRLINQSGNSAGSIDEIITPTFNLSNVSGTMMTFKYAFASKVNTDSSELKVFYSVNCGDTWTQRFSRIGPSLVTAPTNNGNFIPTASQWATGTVNLVANIISGKPNVRLKFQFINESGNNIYIDDINISGIVGSQELLALQYDFEVFPNPSRSNVQVKLNLDRSQQVQMDLMDVTGRTVYSSSNDALSGPFQTEISNDGLSGVYFLRVSVEDGQFTKRIVFIP